MNKSMSIGIIDPVGGHADNYYNYGLAIGLGQNDVEVSYFTSNSTSEIKRDNIETIFVFSNIWSLKNRTLKFFKYFSGLIKSFKYSRKRNIKILHFMVFQLDLLLVLAILLSRINGYKVVVTMHDVKNFNGKSLPKWINVFFYSLIKYVIVHNDFSYKEIKENYPNAKCCIVKHGNYIPFIKKVNPQKITTQLNILFFGQIKKVKGLDILLKAMGILKLKGMNIKLTIAGKVWKDNFLIYQKLIDNLNINEMVDLHIGYIADEKVWNYFNETNLVILPYRRIYQSGVLLMAMSYGRLVLTSNIEAFSSIIKNGVNGYLFENENEQALANRLISLKNEINTFMDIESNAYDFVEKNFDWGKSAQQTKEIYSGIYKII